MWKLIAEWAEWLRHDLDSPLYRLSRYAAWRAAGKPNGTEILMQLRELLKGVKWYDASEEELQPDGPVAYKTFVQVFDTWVGTPGFINPQFDAMLQARDELRKYQEKGE